MLCARWAARSCRLAWSGVACTVRLRRVWLRELVVEADTGLVAR
jgi:hypothetical protein